MCVAFFIFDSLPEYVLLLAFNRDENLERGTHKVHFWPDLGVLGGRDVEGGGTWLGVGRNGRVAFLTNFRENPFDIRSFTGLLLPSRGLLPVNFLTGTATASEYMEDLQSQEFPGYNLFVADLAQQPPELYYYCNRNQQPPQQLDPGLHGIANATIDADWPKVLRGRQRFQQLVDQGKLGGTELPWEDIFGIMRESELLEEDADKLPKTGYGPEFEMKASSIFVAPFETRWGPYGTRSQTVIAVRRNGVAELRERYLEDGKWLELRHTFTMNGTEGKESYDAEK